MAPDTAALRDYLDNTVDQLLDSDPNAASPELPQIAYAAGSGVQLLAETTGDAGLDEINLTKLRIATLVFSDRDTHADVLEELAHLTRLFANSGATQAPPPAAPGLDGLLGSPPPMASHQASSTSGAVPPPDPTPAAQPAPQQAAPAQPARPAPPHRAAAPAPVRKKRRFS